jgi:hypothetical protein
MSREIMLILLDRPRLNISQVSDELRAEPAPPAGIVGQADGLVAQAWW